jgi:hypothetical protein
VLYAELDWGAVIAAIIAGFPAFVAAVYGFYVHRAVKTPSGTSIGRQVESVHHVALGNNYRLRSVTGELGAQPPTEAELQEAQADPPPERRK